MSVSTASLAFSGAGPVSETTRARVLAAAVELGYSGPDPTARSLRQGRTGIIGVVLEETVRFAFRDPVKIAFLDGIAAEVATAGLSLLLLPDVGIGPATNGTAGMDGAVLISCSARIAETVDIARRRSIPVVGLGGSPVTGVPIVGLDEVASTVELARALYDRGHRRVAVVALPIDEDRERGWLTPQREAGAQVWVTRERLIGARAVFPDPPVWIAAGSLAEEGWLAGRAILAGPDGAPHPGAERPSAIIAQSDLLAAGVIRAAEELGITVPAQLSVVGFDGIRIDTLIPHDLTTMVQPAVEQGRAAARMLLDLISGASVEEVQPVGFATEFHLGATIAPAWATD